ncbi:MAG: hypothetical protein AAGE59_33010 [Cyanobacteria bacterium P01_F01_bin.86]
MHVVQRGYGLIALWSLPCGTFELRSLVCQLQKVAAGLAWDPKNPLYAKHFLRQVKVEEPQPFAKAPDSLSP